jgi:hypothetical protein
MSVEFFECASCSETLCDCGDFTRCDCGRKWCDDDCAKEDGWRDDEDANSRSRGTCSYCRREVAEDWELLAFALTRLGVTREALQTEYFENERREEKRADD